MPGGSTLVARNARLRRPLKSVSEQLHAYLVNRLSAALSLSFFAILLAPTATFADRDTPSALAMPSPPDTNDTEESILEVPAPPVVIEGELPHLGPTPEEMLEHFRESLKAQPSFLSSERRLADGTIEARSRFGRFCAPPVPVQTLSGVGGDVRLIAPCASF